MHDLLKWNIALAGLANFIERLPLSPCEDHVFQYHEIVSLFEEASGDVLAEFRVIPDRLSRRIHDAPPSYLWSVRPLGIIQYGYFSRLIGELVHYATNKLHDNPNLVA
jgi:hypothetical protein